MFGARTMARQPRGRPLDLDRRPVAKELIEESNDPEGAADRVCVTAPDNFVEKHR